jgi:hypothetical protein
MICDVRRLLTLSPNPVQGPKTRPKKFVNKKESCEVFDRASRTEAVYRSAMPRPPDTKGKLFECSSGAGML